MKQGKHIGREREERIYRLWKQNPERGYIAALAERFGMSHTGVWLVIQRMKAREQVAA